MRLFFFNGSNSMPLKMNQVITPLISSIIPNLLAIGEQRCYIIRVAFKFKS